MEEIRYQPYEIYGKHEMYNMDKYEKYWIQCQQSILNAVDKWVGFNAINMIDKFY